MKKKPSKDIIVLQQIRPKPCSICQNHPSPLIHNSEQLVKKFYLPQIDSYYFRNLNDIIFDPYSRNFMAYEQVLKDTDYEHFGKYNNWNLIVGSIKKVVLQRCQDNFYGYIDFKEECYDISLGSYLRKKQFLKRKKVHGTPVKSSLSTQQTAQDRNLLECLESRILTRHLQKVQAKKKSLKVLDSLVSNSSIIELKKLTKNLDAMVDPVLRKQRKSMKLKANMLSPKKMKLPTQSNFINLKFFKKEIQKQISIIDKNESDMIVLDKDSENKFEAYLDMNDIKETYGLKIFRPQILVKKTPQKILSSEKQSAPMTPKPRFQFANNQYEQKYTSQTPKQQLNKASNPQSPTLYRANCSSRNSTSSIKSLKKVTSIGSKKTTTKIKSPATKVKK